MTHQRLMICAALSVLLHFAIARALDQLPPRHDPPLPQTVQVRITEPPAEPPPQEDPPKPPDPPDPPKQIHERPRPTQTPVAPAVVPQNTPPVDQPPVPGPTTTAPVFGVTMESTSQGGTMNVPIGNTTRTEPVKTTAQPGEVKPLAPPVAAYEVTKMPVPQGRCSGKYTDEARAAAIEGTVVLDLVVDETGRAREIVVVQGLGGGLTQAAIAALEGCRFTPGEKEGKSVPVRVRGFKIRFLLEENR